MRNDQYSMLRQTGANKYISMCVTFLSFLYVCVFRLMIEQRSRQLFDMIEIADGPFTREACALTSIDLHCGENEWREALRVVGGELR